MIWAISNVVKKYIIIFSIKFFIRKNWDIFFYETISRNNIFLNKNINICIFLKVWDYRRAVWILGVRLCPGSRWGRRARPGALSFRYRLLGVSFGDRRRPGRPQPALRPDTGGHFRSARKQPGDGRDRRGDGPERRRPGRDLRQKHFRPALARRWSSPAPPPGRATPKPSARRSRSLGACALPARRSTSIRSTDGWPTATSSRRTTPTVYASSLRRRSSLPRSTKDRPDRNLGYQEQ